MLKQKQVLVKYFNEHYYSHEYDIDFRVDDFGEKIHELFFADSGVWEDSSGVAAAMIDTGDGFEFKLKGRSTISLGYDQALEMFCLMLNEKDYVVKICKQIKEIEI